MNLLTTNRWLALGIIALGALLYVSVNGVYPRFFSIEWDEEVELHDGRIIEVQVKRTFERVTGGLANFERWGGVHRDTEVSFDAGGSIGQLTHKFQRYDVSFLHHKDDRWYLALGVTTGTPPVKLITNEKSVLVLEPNGTYSSISKYELPSEIKGFNIMPLTPSSIEVAKFNGTKLTIAEKIAHWQAHPRAAGDGPNMRLSTNNSKLKGPN